MKLVRETPFEVGWIVWQIRPPVPSLTVVVKGTFKLVHGDVCAIAEKQVPVTGDLHWDDEPTKSVRYESDMAIHKPRGEVFLAGTCHVPSRVPLRVSAVALEVAAPGASAPLVRKALAVYGDRHWVPSVVPTPSQAEPFTAMPLSWERSFGGPMVEANPLGRGTLDVDLGSGLVRPLPNIEQPDGLMVTPADRPAPVGLFPIPRTWRARTRLTGTVTPAYKDTRWPWFPEDFDFAHFNCAPADQQIEGFWRGDETLKLTNLVAGRPQIETRLPSLKPRAFIELHPRGSQSIGGRKMTRFEEIGLRLDTLAVDTDAGVVSCLWRGLIEIASMELDDVAHLFVAHESLWARTEPPFWRARFLAASGASATEGAGAPPAAPPGMPGAPAIPGAPKLPAIGAPLPPAPAVPAAPALPDAPKAPSAAPPAGSPPASGAPPPQVAPSGAPPPRAAASAPPVAPFDASVRPVVSDATAAELRERVEKALAEKTSLAGVDLTGANLSGLALRDVDLTKAILAGADLSGSRLDGARLDEANLAHANLEGTVLAGARLRGADLSYVRGPRAAFDDAVLDGADLTGARLHLASFFTASCIGTLFFDADLTNATFDEARMDKAELDGARLLDASIQRAFLVDTTLQRCALHRVRFDGSDLSKVRASDGAIFADASLVRVKANGGRFARSDLSRADLSHAELDKADFDRANLDGVRLDGCSLRGARFQHAKLTGASLLKANLHEANLKGADLSRADLRGASFFAAQLLRARMDNARMELANFERTLLAGVVR